jgi:hypothetical protein
MTRSSAAFTMALAFSACSGTGTPAGPEKQEGSLGKYAPNPAPEVTLLGDAQWAWLEEQLRVPAEVRLIASSGPFVDLNLGLVEIGWDAAPSPSITLKALDVDAGVAFEHAVALERLRPS